MKPAGDGGLCYEFYFPEVDVHVRVENYSREVVVRATSANFSERRKTVFIRHLADEGFIPAHFRWLAESCSSGFSGIRWMVDTSWLRIHPELTQRTTRFMRNLLVDAGIIWLTVLMIIYLRSP